MRISFPFDLCSNYDHLFALDDEESDDDDEYKPLQALPESKVARILHTPQTNTQPTNRLRIRFRGAREPSSRSQTRAWKPSKATFVHSRSLWLIPATHTWCF